MLLVGFDFGSTTSSSVVARAAVKLDCITGRMEFATPAIRFRAEPCFTPFSDGLLDEAAVTALVDEWMKLGDADPDEVFAGGALVTGLAAQSANARHVSDIVRKRLGEAVIAVADDPSLESWLAFMGSSLGESRARPEVPIINLDIGGGTTNPALGLGGTVLATGCAFVGARHLRFEPGTYRLTHVTAQGRAVMAAAGVRAVVGDELTAGQVGGVVATLVRALEDIASGEPRWARGLQIELEQVAFAPPPTCAEPLLCFSGGVGELVYRQFAGLPLPGITAYGDIGIDLARGIVESPFLSRSLAQLEPENGGRATVYGLALHSTEVSGSTLYLPDPAVLPLHDVPIVARVPLEAGVEILERAVHMASRSSRGACVQVESPDGTGPSAGDVRPALGREIVTSFGARLSAAIAQTRGGAQAPLVVLLPFNAGKTLGNYATCWGASGTPLVVIDEIVDRQAHFVNVGALRDGFVPVSFYGMGP